jgi:hypothetical protein
MLTHSGHALAGLRKKGLKARRGLGFEPLESRTLLSAVSPAVPVARVALPWSESPSALVGTDFATGLAGVESRVQQGPQWSPAIEWPSLTAHLVTSLASTRATSADFAPAVGVPNHRATPLESPVSGPLAERGGEPDGSRLFVERPPGEAGASRPEAVVLRANPRKEGGFVDVGNTGLALSRSPVGRLMETVEQAPAPRPLAAQVASFSAADFISFDPAWIESAVPGEGQDGSVAQAANPPETAAAESPPSESGFASGLLAELGVSTDLIADLAGTAIAEATQTAALNAGQTTPDFEAAPADASPRLASALERSLLSVPEKEKMAQDRPLDSDSPLGTLSEPSGRSGLVAAERPTQNPVEANENTLAGSIWKDSRGKGYDNDDFGDVNPGNQAAGNQTARNEAGSLNETRAAPDDRANTGERAEEGGESQRAATIEKYAFDSAEGGMIELVAASFTSADSPYASIASAASPDETPSIGARPVRIGKGDVRMDNGVGLFQAFELASVPACRVGVSDLPPDRDLPPARREEADPPAGTTALLSTADAAAQEPTPAQEPRHGLPLRRVAAAPTIVVVASLLTAAQGIYQEEESTKSPGRPSTRRATR